MIARCLDKNASAHIKEMLLKFRTLLFDRGKLSFRQIAVLKSLAMRRRVYGEVKMASQNRIAQICATPESTEAPMVIAGIGAFSGRRDRYAMMLLRCKERPLSLTNQLWIDSFEAKLRDNIPLTLNESIVLENIAKNMGMFYDLSQPRDKDLWEESVNTLQ